MRVIVDPDAKVPDEIVRRIPLPKPGQPATGTPPQSDKTIGQTGPSPVRKGQGNALRRLTSQGREFGQETAEQAKTTRRRSAS